MGSNNSLKTLSRIVLTCGTFPGECFKICLEALARQSSIRRRQQQSSYQYTKESEAMTIPDFMEHQRSWQHQGSVETARPPLGPYGPYHTKKKFVGRVLGPDGILTTRTHHHISPHQTSQAERPVSDPFLTCF